METIDTASVIETVNLFNNELVKSFDEMTGEQIESKIKLADKAFQKLEEISKI